MGELPDPRCADCVAFSGEGKDAEGRILGRCAFRPELGMISSDLLYCHVFQVRKSRADAVRIPVPGKKRAPRGGGGGSRTPSPRTISSTAAQRPTLKRPTTGDTSGEISMDRDGLKQVLRELLEEETLYGYVEMGQRWEGGTLVFKPADPELQTKEIPLETFFHKVVMVRDRLRVLEAKINGAAKLSDAEKVELQQYVSKCYGTLTTFNVLFRDKADQFSSK